MPIHGLVPSLLEVGKIKIGMKGDEVVSKNDVTFRKAERIDHFRIVTNERDDEDNYILNTELLETIKKGGKAKYNKDGKLVCIPIRVLYNDINIVFPHEVVSMVNWKRSCSGDRKNAITRDGRKIKCPCKRLDADYNGKDKCKYSGVLSCIIEGSNIGGCHKFRTKGYNSVNSILSSLLLIKTLTGGLLVSLPLQLIVTSKRTINPVSGKALTIQVVSIESRGSLDELQQYALNMGSERIRLIENMHELEKDAKKAVSPETEDEEKEIFEEFYPDNIINETKTKKASIDTEPHEELEVKAELEEFKKERRSIKKEALQENEKVEPSKTDTGEIGSEVAETTESETNKAQAESEKDDPYKKQLEEQISEATGIPIPIRKSQLVEILKLKSDALKVNDQKSWHKLVKSMKFPNVTKANDMTAKQGDKFIEYLKALKDAPF